MVLSKSGVTFVVKRELLLAASLVIASHVSCFAGETGPVKVNPPVQTKAPTGNTHDKQTLIQSKLQSSLDSGAISSDDVDRYQEALGQIHAKEDDLRTRGGFTPAASQDLMKQLEEIETDLDKRAKAASLSKTSSSSSSSSSASSSATNNTDEEQE